MIGRIRAFFGSAWLACVSRASRRARLRMVLLRCESSRRTARRLTRRLSVADRTVRELRDDLRDSKDQIERLESRNTTLKQEMDAMAEMMQRLREHAKADVAMEVSRRRQAEELMNQFRENVEG